MLCWAAHYQSRYLTLFTLLQNLHTTSIQPIGILSFSTSFFFYHILFSDTKVEMNMLSVKFVSTSQVLLQKQLQMGITSTHLLLVYMSVEGWAAALLSAVG